MILELSMRLESFEKMTDKRIWKVVTPMSLQNPFDDRQIPKPVIKLKEYLTTRNIEKEIRDGCKGKVRTESF